MKKTFWNICCLVIIFISAAYINSVIAADPMITELQTQVAVLQKEVTALKTALADTQTTLTKDINGLDSRLDLQESVVKVGPSVTIASTGSLTLRSAGTVSVNGSLISMNGGSTPVATIKSTIVGTSIKSGSTTVLVP